jgi:hypothetical protein
MPRGRIGPRWVVPCVFLFIGTIVFFASPQLHAQTNVPTDLVVTKIVNYWPPDPDKRIIISRVNRSDSGPWVELYNPTEVRLTLRGVRFASAPRKSISVNTRIKPNQYYYLCSRSSCKNLPRKTSQYDTVAFKLKVSDGIRVLSSKSDKRKSFGSDAVGWGTDVPSLFREDLAADTTGTILRRRKRSGGCPVDTQLNRNDFTNRARLSPDWGYRDCSGTYPSDQNEYIEIYNAGEWPVDPVQQNYRIKDSLNAEGEPVDRWYDFEPFPGSDPTRDTSLDPGQVGLIVRPNVDFLAFSDLTQRTLKGLSKKSEMLKGTIYQQIRKGTIKLYTLSREGDLTFLTDGLHNQRMERLTLERPGKTPPQVNIPQIDEYWSIYEVNPFEARIKIKLTGPNSDENWTIQSWGTPGRISDD